MDEYLQDFLVDTADALGQIDRSLLRLETDPHDGHLVIEILRGFHSIKGTSGFLNLARIGRLCHAGESALVRIRDGALEPSASVIQSLLRCCDKLRSIVTNVKATGKEGDSGDEDLIAELEGLPNPSEATQQPGTALVERTEAPRWERPNAPFRTNDSTLRVGTDLLDELMANVFELAQYRNQLMHLIHSGCDASAFCEFQALTAITRRLQENAAKMWVRPVGETWTALPRVVRDLARQLGKKIDLVMEGTEIELERETLRLIKDSLVHMLRNAVDHGLETAEVRAAMGKPETGQVRLRASVEGGRITVEISDDGRGLDAADIRRTAVARGIATKAEVAAMSDQKVFRLILLPGFSTVRNVTAVSGRGVGMDVVRANIERLGGALEIASVRYRGTTFTMRIPLPEHLTALDGNYLQIGEAAPTERFGTMPPHYAWTAPAMVAAKSF